MDHQLIAKITELVLEKIVQVSTSNVSYPELSQGELQEWQTFHLMNHNEGNSQHTSVTHNIYEALSELELQNWESIHHQQAFSTTLPSQTNDLITINKF
ncbi:hypothetical protein [Lysinibacillus agricola]|uniref:hypothetical protein n=1 Tax=Lysinibacillus agricola TaxID=2590012 RepID=UPI003C144430